MSKLKLLLAGCVVGLSVVANAGLSLVHYYSYTDGMTNDLVGTANGTIAGTAQLIGGALVTDQSFGQLDASGNAQNSMTLPTNVVENITNAFSIVTWIKVGSGGGINNTTYAFSKGQNQTDDYVLSAPASWDYNYAGRVEVRQAGGTGVDVDNVNVLVNGFASFDNGIQLYQTVFTYDGNTTISYYVNGIFQSTATIDSPMDLSAWDKVGVNGGSPWPDNTTKGTNYAFGIFDQELNADQVASLYSKGMGASVAQIQQIGDEPLLFGSEYPTGTAVLNDVVITNQIIDGGSQFLSASVYLDDFSTEIGSSVDNLGTGTNQINTAIDPQTLLPGSTHTVYIIANAQTPAAVMTNSWTFTMADQFAITGSPDPYALAYDFMPNVSAQIVELNDTIDVPHMFINGSEVSPDTIDGLGTSSTVTVGKVIGPLAPGSNVTAMVVVDGNPLNGYSSFTNEWSFTMGGSVGVTTWTTNNPTAAQGPNDILYTDFATADTENVSGIADDATGHGWTYVANNRPAQGQIFTTGSTPAGYELQSVWLRAAAYDDGGANNPAGSTFTVRITDPGQTGTVNFVKSTQVLTNLNGGLTAGDGRWVQFRLQTPVILSPNKQYGFDVGGPAGDYFNTSGVNIGNYANGVAYRTGVSNNNGVGDNLAELATGADRTFMVQMATATAPFSLNEFTPSGSGIANPVQLKAEVQELNGTFDDANTKLFLDGVEQTKNATVESPPTVFTVTADVGELEPLSTHTGMVVMASSSPVQTVTNTTVFTIGDAFTFTSFEPTGLLLTNDTSISVQFMNGADYFDGTAQLFVDDVPKAIDNIDVATTNTITLNSSGTLDAGEHTAMVVVGGTLYGPVTNSWVFSVKEVTTDKLWNINIAGNLSGADYPVADGVIAVGPSSGSNLWNNIKGASGGSGGGGGQAATNSFVVTDSNGANPIGYEVRGIGYWGDTDVSFQDMFDGWVGANAFMNLSCSISNLDNTASYDIYIYSTWNWTQNPVTYDLVEGFADTTELVCNETQSTAATSDPNDYSGLVEGNNYVVFRDVTPTLAGVISYTGGYNVDGVMSGVQIRQHPGQGALPYADVISKAPTGSLQTNAVTLEAVMTDYLGTVNTNNVVLLLDGSPVPFTATQSGSTTTVTHATGVLSAGTHTAGIIANPGESTNKWTFTLGYEVPVATSLVHEWDFQDGSGATVTDIIGGANGTIIGTNYAWIAGGGLDLLGGGGSTDWNAISTNASYQANAGAYVDLPNGIISALDDQVTIEATYISDVESAWWQDIYAFGSASTGTEDVTEGWPGDHNGSTYLNMIAYAGNGARTTVTTNGTPESIIMNTGNQNTGKLTHNVWVFDASQHIAKLYQNGVLVDEQVVADIPLSNLNDVNNWLGRSMYSDGMLNGKIYDLRIYNGVMTASEVAARYLAVAPAVEWISHAPAVYATTTTPQIQSVFKDGSLTVNTNQVVLLIDGVSVGTIDSVTKNSTTTTVSHVTSPLSLGVHTAGIILAPGAETNEWSFLVGIDVPMVGNNGNFEAGVANVGGFDSPADVPGWTDISIVDSGVGGPGSWWATYNNGYSAFMHAGDSAYMVSDGYTVLDGDEYAVVYVGKSWDGSSQWTANLFYDDPTNNVFGSFVHSVNGDWTYYVSPSIAASPASVGGTLGISFVNTGAGFANLDDVHILIIKEGSAAAAGPTIGVSVSDGSLIMSWTEGGTYNVLTNGDLTDPAGWAISTSGMSPITNNIGSEAQLFFKLSN